MADADTADEPQSFARWLGVGEADLEAILPAVADALTALGMDGAGCVARLRAGRSFAAALALPPALNAMLYARAYKWFDVGRPDKAEPLFRALCVLDGGRRDHWLGYGICLAARGDARAGEMAFRIAAEIDPASPLAYYHLLDQCMRRAAWGEAAGHLAAYDARPAQAPAPLAAEVERYRRALQTRGVVGQAAAP